MLSVFPCFFCVPFPLLPKLLWRGPRRHAPRICFPFLELPFQQPDLEVSFPLILHMLLQPVCKAIGFLVKVINCRLNPLA